MSNIQQQGVTFNGKLRAGYDLNYTYGSKPHQIDNIKDENYRTEGKNIKTPKKTENVYEYDENGNLIFVSKNKKKDEKQNERKLLWDEENRLEAVSDNGYVSLYTYDAGSERVTKLSGNGESVYVNSKNAGKRTQTNKYTAYINPYFVLSSGGQYTKHIMIGSQRIVSKLGDVGSFGQDPRRIEYAGTTESIKVDYKTKYQKSQQIFRDRYKSLDVVYNGVDNDDYRGGESFCCGKKKKDGFGARGGITNNDKPELYQYYYHPDHLGSSSYITNLDGDIAQHIEYVPFGEVFLNEQNNRWNTPYLFNAKELDEETGLYYYGARYYNPRESVWLSVDPLALDGNHLGANSNTGGVYDSSNLNVYSYVHNRPVNAIDPNGRDIIILTNNGIFKASKGILMRTELGRALWNEYGNSKTNDIYINSSSTYSKGARTVANTWYNFSKLKGNFTVDGKINFKGIKSYKENFGSFEGLKLLDTSDGKKVHLINLNEKYFSKNSDLDNYELAEVVYHEIYAHIKITDKLSNKQKKDNLQGGGNIDHELYGAKGTGLGASSAKKNSPAHKIKRILFLLRHKDKTGDETVK